MPHPSISAFWLSVKSLLQKMLLGGFGFTKSPLPAVAVLCDDSGMLLGDGNRLHRTARDSKRC